MQRTQFSTQQPEWITKIAVTISILGTLILAGCGGSASLPQDNGGDGGPKFNESKPATVQVRIGDSPSERVVALKLTLNSIQATPSSGDKVSLLASPVTMEVTHLAASNQLVGEISMPQGSYKQIAIDVKSATVTYLDPVTNQPVKKQFSSVSTSTVKFSPALQIAAGGNLLNIDVDVAKTVKLDLVKNTVGLNTPVFNITAQTVATSGQQRPETGAVEHITGQVTAVSGSAFTIKSGQSGAALTFGTNQDTVLVSANLNSLTGTIVNVEATSLVDGTLLATKVANVNTTTGVSVEGLLTGYTDWGYLNVVVQDGTGAGMTDSMLGANMALSLGNASFSYDATDVDMTGLPFTFDVNSIMPGQRVEVQSFNAVQTDPQGKAAGFVTAATVELEKQTLSGRVNDYADNGDGTATFNLVLASDGNSYLNATNPGTVQVEVHIQSKTDLDGVSGDLSGKSVMVRGLLFFYAPSGFGIHSNGGLKALVGGGGGGSSPYFAMVASRVSQ
jgi:hypothetical protein